MDDVPRLQRTGGVPGKAKVIELDLLRTWYPAVYACIDCGRMNSVYIPDAEDCSKYLKCKCRKKGKRFILISGLSFDQLQNLAVEISPELWGK